VEEGNGAGRRVTAVFHRHPRGDWCLFHAFVSVVLPMDEGFGIGTSLPFRRSSGARPRWAGGPMHPLPTISGGSELDADCFPKIYKMVEVRSLLSSAAVQPTPVLLSYLPNFRPGAVNICSSSRHSISSCSPRLLSPSSSSGFSPSTP